MRVLVLGGYRSISGRLTRALEALDNRCISAGLPEVGTLTQQTTALAPFSVLVSDIAFDMVLCVSLRTIARLAINEKGILSIEALRANLETIRNRGSKLFILRVSPEPSCTDLEQQLPGCWDLLKEYCSRVILSHGADPTQTLSDIPWRWCPIPWNAEPSIDRVAIEARLNDLRTKPIRIIHVPWNTTSSETQCIKAVGEALAQRFSTARFEIVLPEQLSNEQSLTKVCSQADIIIEQLTNPSFGLLAIAGMASGAVVVSRNDLSAQNQWHILENAPIVQATSADVEKKIDALLKEPRSLRDLSKRSLAYVRHYFDAERCGQLLVQALE